MSLSCRLGWHKADPAVQWNHGFYFTRCRACRRDLVRTAYEGWHEPKGFRVVWQDQPPAGFRAASLEPVPASEMIDDGQMELPIQSVLRSIEPLDGQLSAPPPEALEAPDAPDAADERAAEVPQEAQPAPEPAPEPAPAPKPPRRMWDFMEEDAAPFVPPAASPLTRSRAAARQPDEPPEMLELTVTASARTRPGVDGAEASVSHLTAGSASHDGPAGSDWRRGGRWSIAMFGLLMLLVGGTMVAALADRSRGPVAAPPVQVARQPPRPASEPAPSAASDFRPARPQAAAQSFVAASLLNCRSAPSLSSEVVRTLSRGTAVSPIARDGDWASLAVDGRQCWALGRYVAEVRPL